MLTELSRREKAANIKPDADIDAFMKASTIYMTKSSILVRFDVCYLLIVTLD